jgi:hypothetical protein
MRTPNQRPLGHRSTWAVAPKTTSPERPGDYRPFMPDWLPAFLAAALSIVVLTLALLEQRRRIHRRTWDKQLLRELRVWDGLLPNELQRPQSPGD